MMRRFLTDTEILSVDICSSDPRSSYHLLAQERVPVDLKWERLVAIYDTAETLTCMRPGCGQAHNEGAIVEIRCPDGIIGMINVGHVCGAKAFPAEYKAGNRFDGQSTRRQRTSSGRSALVAEHLERRKLISQKRLVLDREAETLQNFELLRGPYTEFDQVRRQFQSFMPDLYESVVRAIQGGGRMRVLARGPRKSDAFRTALEGVGRGGGMIDDGFDTVHIVIGQHFFSRGDLVERLERVVDEYKRAINDLRPDNLDVRTMKEKFILLSRLDARLDQIQRQYGDLLPALSADNLRGFARWAKRDDPSSPFVFANNMLIRQASGRLPQAVIRARMGNQPATLPRLRIMDAA